MEADFREAVERLTGRKVLAFISGNHCDPDTAAELFILDSPLWSLRKAPVGAWVSEPRGTGRGEHRHQVRESRDGPRGLLSDGHTSGGRACDSGAGAAFGR